MTQTFGMNFETDPLPSSRSLSFNFTLHRVQYSKVSVQYCTCGQIPFPTLVKAQKDHDLR